MTTVHSMLGFAMLAGVACGSGDDDGGGDDVGLGRDTPLDQIDGADGQAYCDDAAQEFDSEGLLRFLCYTTGVGQGAGCAAYVDSCLAQPFDDGALPLQCALGGPVPLCTGEVTLGQFEDCLLGWLDQIAAAGRLLTCDPSSFDEIDEALQPPDACLAISDACGGLFG